MSAFDWPALMRAGMHGLRLSPDAFWALTPVELAILLGQGYGPAPLTRTGLDALLRDYPDQERGEPE